MLAYTKGLGSSAATSYGVNFHLSFYSVDLDELGKFSYFIKG